MQENAITGLHWWTGLVDWTGALDLWTVLKMLFLHSLMRTHQYGCIWRDRHFPSWTVAQIFNN